MDSLFMLIQHFDVHGGGIQKFVKKPIKIVFLGLLLHLGLDRMLHINLIYICIADVEENIVRDWIKYLGRLLSHIFCVCIEKLYSMSTDIIATVSHATYILFHTNVRLKPAIFVLYFLYIFRKISTRVGIKQRKVNYITEILDTPEDGKFTILVFLHY
jgi:hypothetical protein